MSDTLPQFDEVAERGILGSAIVDARAATIVFDAMAATDFYGNQHARAFVLLKLLHQKNPDKDIDDIEISRAVEDDGHIPKDFFMRCVEETPTSANVERYIQIVREMSVRRQLQKMAATVIQNLSTGSNGETVSNWTEKTIQDIQAYRRGVTVSEIAGSSAALAKRAEDIISGKIKSVPWGSWPTLTRITQALIPGTITIVCGGQGMGKSLFSIEACLHWIEEGVTFKYLGLEENRPFYLERALAQLDERAELTNMDFKKEHPESWRSAHARHSETLEVLGSRIVEAETMTSNQIIEWVKSEVKENRVLVIDPITAKDPSDQVWKDDAKFMNALRSIMKSSGSSLILVTHPKQMNATGKKESAKGWGDDMAGGAAYPRFSSTAIFLTGGGEFETVHVRTTIGTIAAGINRRIRIAKTRNGYGQWWEVGFVFDSKTLRHIEKGVICS